MTLLTYDQAAAELAVSKRTVERLVEEGELEVIHVAGARRIRPEAVDRFVAARAVTRVRDRSHSSGLRAVRGPSSFRSELRQVS